MFPTIFGTCASPLAQQLQTEIEESLYRILYDGDWAKYRPPIIDELCDLIAKDLNVNTVRLCASGSMAIELALRGCDLREGDEVICGALDYPGNIRAIRLLGGQPVVVDCAQERWTIDVETIAAEKSERVRAVIASHLYGDIADVDQLRVICENRGWVLIEDVCQMPGGKLDGRALGSFGHVAALSFGGSKPLTSGSGGAILTSDPRIAQRVASYVDRPSDATAFSSLQAAVLLPQWRHLSELVLQQQTTMASVHDACQTATHRWQWPSPLHHRANASYYKIPIRVREPSTQGVSAQNASTQNESDGKNFAVREWIIDRLSMLKIPVGAPFRAITKTASGRGRIISSACAEDLSRSSFLLDHRSLAGSSESVHWLVEQLIAIHDQQESP